MSQPDARDPWWMPAPLEGPACPRAPRSASRPRACRCSRRSPPRCAMPAARLQAAGWEVEELPEPAAAAGERRYPAAALAGREPPRRRRRLWREGDPDALAIFGYMERLCPSPSCSTSRTRCKAGRAAAAMAAVPGTLPGGRHAGLRRAALPDHSDIESFEGFQRMMAEQLPQLGLPVLGLPGLTVSTGLVGSMPVGRAAGRRALPGGRAAGGRRGDRGGGVPPAPIDPA